MVIVTSGRSMLLLLRLILNKYGWRKFQESIKGKCLCAPVPIVSVGTGVQANAGIAMRKLGSAASTRECWPRIW